MILTNKRVLVVDDDPFMSSALEWIVEKAGGVCVRCSDGKEAIKQLSTTRCHLLVTDLSMPNLNGVELLERVNQRWPHLPAIIVTGHREGPLREQLAALGKYPFLTKPFSKASFLATTQNL